MSHHPFPWQEAFLAALRSMPVVQHACDSVGILRCTAYRARKADSAFAQAWDDAMEAGVDKAEQEAFRRAVDGWTEPVIAQGRLVRDEEGAPLLVRKYSDMLLSKVLSARRKAYGTQRTEITGADGGPVSTADETARAARVAYLLEQAKRRRAMEEAEPDDFA